jgi:hypothetical protein
MVQLITIIAAVLPFTGALASFSLPQDAAEGHYSGAIDTNGNNSISLAMAG